MNNMPLVSIVVPVYNVEDYLERCHMSLLKQDYEAIEIIYVDDGSSDSSGAICDRFSDTADNVRVIHKDNAGLGYARNTGMEAAKGKYVVFVDSDDYIETSLISKLIDPVLKDVVSFTLAGFTRVSRTTVVPKPLPDIDVPFVGNKEVLEGILCRMLGDYPGHGDYIEMSCCARLYDLDIIREHEIWFRSERDCLSEDIDFNARYLQHVHSSMCVNSVGYYYCDNSGSLTTSYRSDRFQRQERLYRKLISVSEELNLGKEAVIRLDNTLAAIARYSIKLEVANATWRECRELLQKIDDICCDSSLHSALQELKKHKLPIANRMVNALIEKNRVLILVIVMKLKIVFGI